MRVDNGEAADRRVTEACAAAEEARADVRARTFRCRKWRSSGPFDRALCADCYDVADAATVRRLLGVLVVSTTTELHAFATRVANKDAFAFWVARYTFTHDDWGLRPTKAKYLTAEGWRTAANPRGWETDESFQPTLVISGIDVRAASSSFGDFIKKLLDDDLHVQRKLLALFRDAVEAALGEQVGVDE